MTDRLVVSLIAVLCAGPAFARERLPYETSGWDWLSSTVMFTLSFALLFGCGAALALGAEELAPFGRYGLVAGMIVGACLMLYVAVLAQFGG